MTIGRVWLSRIACPSFRVLFRSRPSTEDHCIGESTEVTAWAQQLVERNS